MIITFATQKGGAGKTTLAIAFANYISSLTGRKINVFDFDYQKSFYSKWLEDDELNEEKLYDVSLIKSTTIEEIVRWKEEQDINIFDLAGTLDQDYSDILVYSDFIVIPFEYSDISTKSTLVFINLLGIIESMAERIFIKSKFEKGFKYPNQDGMDSEIRKYGTIISSPVFKRNTLQTINTRKLSYEQKYAVKNSFNELIDIINETLQITL